MRDKWRDCYANGLSMKAIKCAGERREFIIRNSSPNNRCCMRYGNGMLCARCAGTHGNIRRDYSSPGHCSASSGVERSFFGDHNARKNQVRQISFSIYPRSKSPLNALTGAASPVSRMSHRSWCTGREWMENIRQFVEWFSFCANMLCGGEHHSKQTIQIATWFRPMHLFGNRWNCQRIVISRAGTHLSVRIQSAPSNVLATEREPLDGKMHFIATSAPAEGETRWISRFLSIFKLFSGCKNHSGIKLPGSAARTH